MYDFINNTDFLFLKTRVSKKINILDIQKKKKKELLDGKPKHHSDALISAKVYLKTAKVYLSLAYGETEKKNTAETLF